MYDLFLWVLLISAAIFMIVAVLIIVALWRGRANAELPKQDFGSHRAEMFWMVGPVLVVLWIAAISAKLILTMNAVPKSHPPRQQTADAELTVIGHQWWWEVKYNGSGITAANEIHLPMGKKIRVKLESSDVIHCFWVPQLARKMDVIPGRENYIWIQADKPSVYQGRCAEFCGTQHAWMNFKVYVLDPQSYANWETRQKAVAAAPRQPDAVAGQAIFFSQTCINCHSIQGTPATASIGPDLTHVSQRKELGGGVIENSTENLARWMKNPQAIKPGCKMPDFKFSDDQVRQIVAYLQSIP
jgi:cytochrome c oxidase subunit 2